MSTIRLTTPASTLATIGQAWLVTFWTLDSLGHVSTAETPTVTVTRPDGSTTPATPAVQPDLSWLVSYTSSVAGRHLVHAATLEDAVDACLYVDMPVTEAGMPTAADASVYLGSSAASWSMDQITGALAAERSAQRDRCGERAVYPDALREALLRRVQRNLAMRRIPLAVPTGDADGGPSVIPGRDPEVRRLEGPYRRTPVG